MFKFCNQRTSNLSVGLRAVVLALAFFTSIHSAGSQTPVFSAAEIEKMGNQLEAESKIFCLPPKFSLQPPTGFAAPSYPGNIIEIRYRELPKGKYLTPSTDAIIQSKDSPSLMVRQYRDALVASGWQIVLISTDPQLSQHGYKKSDNPNIDHQFISARKRGYNLFFSSVTENDGKNTMASISVSAASMPKPGP